MIAEELRRALHGVPDDYKITLTTDQHIRGSIDYGNRRATAALKTVVINDNIKTVFLHGVENDNR